MSQLNADIVNCVSIQSPNPVIIVNTPFSIAPTSGLVMDPVTIGPNTTNLSITSGVAIGDSARAAGTNDISIGKNAGLAGTVGMSNGDNIGIGKSALALNVFGEKNIAIGTNTLSNQVNTISTYGLSVSQTGNTVTGIGTTFTSDMVGGTIYFVTDAIGDTITAFNSPTSIDVLTSNTFANQPFNIQWNGTYYGDIVVSVSGTSVTGTGTSFTSDMVGSTLTVLFNGLSDTIASYISPTSLTLSSGFFTTEPQAFTISNPSVVYYGDSTASCSGTTITGVNTNFTIDMVGGTITLWEDAFTDTITVFNSPTSIDVSTGGTYANQAFSIAYSYTYNIGTADITGTTITGYGTTFTPNMATSGSIYFVTDAVTLPILSFVDATTLMVAPGDANTFVAQPYIITYDPQVYQPSTVDDVFGNINGINTTFTPNMFIGNVYYYINAATVTITSVIDNITMTEGGGNTYPQQPFRINYSINNNSSLISQNTNVITSTTSTFTPEMVYLGNVYYYTDAYTSSIDSFINANNFNTLDGSFILDQPYRLTYTNLYAPLASISGSVITGLNSNFTSTMIGGTIKLLTSNTTYNINGYTSPTSITVIETDIQSDQPFEIVYGLNFNVGIGYNSLFAQNGPSGSTAIGAYALSSNISGDGNTAVGYNAGASITTGSSNTLVGYNADISGVNTNCVVIGQGSSAGVGSSNSVILGQGASSTVSNSIALGQGAVVTLASQAFAISVNSASYTAGVGLTWLVNGNVERVNLEQFDPAATVYYGTGTRLANSGSGSVTIGSGASTAIPGFSAVAVGFNSLSNGDWSVAVGRDTIASTNRATAIGPNARVITGDSGTAIGRDAQVNSDFSVAVGSSTEGRGINCTAIGAFCRAGDTFLETGCIAIGTSCLARGDNAISIGNNADGGAGGDWISMGSNSNAGDGTVALGFQCSAIGTNSVSLGYQANSTTNNTVSIGFLATTLAPSGIAIGQNATVALFATNSVAIGNTATTSNTNAIAIGNNANAAFVDSIAIGNGATVTSANRALAINIDPLSVTSGVELRCRINGTNEIISLAAGGASLDPANPVYHGTGTMVGNGGAGTVTIGAGATSGAARATIVGSTATGGTGVDNTAVGFGTLVGITTGTSNTVVGSNAFPGALWATGFNNTGLGYNVGLTLGSAGAAGQDNILIGSQADVDASNTQFGIGIGGTSVVFSGSIAIGYGTQSLDTQNVVLGNGAFAGFGGTNSVVIGNNANLAGLATNSVKIGGNVAGVASLRDVVIGQAAEANASTDNVCIGASSKVSGAKNVVMGAFAATNAGLTLLNNSVIIGGDACGAVTGTRTDLICIGRNAGNAAIADNNVYIGSNAGALASTAIESTAVGYFALNGNAGNSNTAVGNSCMIGATGAQNTAMGVSSLANLSGNFTTAIGYNAGLNIALANNNTLVGSSAGLTLSSGSSNVLIGSISNVTAAGTTTSVAVGQGAIVADSGIAIGQGAILNAAATSGIAIGKGATLSAGATGGAIVIGTGFSTTAAGAINLGSSVAANVAGGFFVGHNAGAFTINGCGFIAGTNELVEITSALRFKENIRSLESVSERIAKLRPVRYVGKPGMGDGRENIGLIAEEVEVLFPELVTYNPDGQVQGLMYERLASILLKEVQDANLRIEQLEQRLETFNSFEERLAALENK